MLFYVMPHVSDVNECDTNNGGCAHNCSNSEGSFECTCLDGYNDVYGNGTKCTGTLLVNLRFNQVYLLTFLR